MYSQTIFSNGLKLITVPLKNTKTITVLILFPVGSRYESERLNGASHFIEHMMFKGTKKRPDSLAIAKELDQIGAQYNAFTSKDHTGYWVKSAREKLEISLDVLADMLFNSVFDQREFQHEKGVICQEIKMYEENPLFYINEFFETLLFQKHALGQLVSGQFSNIRKMSRQALLKYKELFYHSGQMIVTVAGGVEKSQIVRLVKKYFVQYQGKRKKIKYSCFKQERHKTGPRVKIFFKDLKQAQIALGGFAYPYNHPKIEASILLSIILGGNMSSRLFTEIRVKRGLAYSVKTGLGTYQDTGNYVIQAGVDKEKVLETIKVILDELKKIKENGATKEELVRAKDYIEGTMRISLEDSASLAGWYGRQVLLTKKVFSPAERLKRIRRVTQAEIQKLAQDLFSRQGLNLALIGPFKNRRPLLRILEKNI
ncbi:insulinase family protein [Patescibacteria group bacterium]|nr:insulinase family protein [Patescibacteria group bacterium]